MKKISGNILELVGPDSVKDMMQDGYNYMEREDHIGNLACLELPMRPSLDLASFKTLPSSIDIARIAERITSIRPDIPRVVRRTQHFLNL